MSEKLTLKSWVNPIAMFSLEPIISEIEVRPSAEVVLRDLCSYDVDSSLEAMATRCGEVTPLNNALSLVPSEKNILTKLIWPLRNARACYVMGNYIGTIALCGMMSEMAAIVIFDIADPTIDDKPLNKKQQVRRFGCRFERLGQKQRIKELEKLGIINPTLVNAFETVRKARRSYLHFWSHDHGAVPRDAVKVFGSAAQIAGTLLGLHFHEGKTLLPPAIMRYLKKRGLYEPVKPKDLP